MGLNINLSLFIIPFFENLNNLTLLYLFDNQLEGCYPEGLSSLCGIDYNFSNNPLLPWKGVIDSFCLGEEQIGAPCDNDNLTNTGNDVILSDYSCGSMAGETSEDLPFFFTPNGDGVEDVFSIPEIYTRAGAQLLIFNRWGKEVFRTDTFDVFWDGTDDSGSALPDDNYFYQLIVY